LPEATGNELATKTIYSSIALEQEELILEKRAKKRISHSSRIMAYLVVFEKETRTS
jgi:hypothetical protein